MPDRRFQAIDVADRVRQISDVTRLHQKALFCSFHTTAGYLGPSLSARLDHRHDLLSQFFQAFHTLFPQGAEYSHDRMELRSELTDDQKVVERPNGDSHLTYIGAGMRNCVTYRIRPHQPVYFIELDGARERKTHIVGFDSETSVARIAVDVPVGGPVDFINLADPALGMIEKINDLIRRSGIERGRVDVALAPAERHAGLTVNEYETLLIQKDLTVVLQNPLHFAGSDQPLVSFMDALRLDQSSLDRLTTKVLSFPAKRAFRSRRVSFLAAADGEHNVPQLIRGTYQSPILVQWRRPENAVRRIEVTVMELS